VWTCNLPCFARYLYDCIGYLRCYRYTWYRVTSGAILCAKRRCTESFGSGRLDTVYVCRMYICLGVRRQLPADSHAGGRSCIQRWKRQPTVSVVTAGRLMRNGVPESVVHCAITLRFLRRRLARSVLNDRPAIARRWISSFAPVRCRV